MDDFGGYLIFGNTHTPVRPLFWGTKTNQKKAFSNQNKRSFGFQELKTSMEPTNWWFVTGVSFSSQGIFRFPAREPSGCGRHDFSRIWFVSKGNKFYITKKITLIQQYESTWCWKSQSRNNKQLNVAQLAIACLWLDIRAHSNWFRHLSGLTCYVWLSYWWYKCKYSSKVSIRLCDDM